MMLLFKYIDATVLNMINILKLLIFKINKHYTNMQYERIQFWLATKKYDYIRFSNWITI